MENRYVINFCLNVSYLFFRDPAVTEDLKIDKNKIDKREKLVAIVALATLACLGIVYWRLSNKIIPLSINRFFTIGKFNASDPTLLASCLPLGGSAINLLTLARYISSLIVGLFAFIPFIITYKEVEDHQAREQINEVALYQFKNQEFVCVNVLKNIARRQNLIKTLSDEGYDLLKTSQEGNHSLLDYVDNIEDVKILINKGAKIKAHHIIKFMDLDRLPNQNCLQFIFNMNNFKVEDYRDEDQVSFWLNVKKIDTAWLLYNKGFNINVENSEGKTAFSLLLDPNHTISVEQRILLERRILYFNGGINIMSDDPTQLKAAFEEIKQKTDDLRIKSARK